ncbi:hypothetical protein D0U04_07230 [Bacillus clarus]|uniref:Uncharacterized protein n=1 Tax=Bacillus clarus TaxID=2338372 RepID=A0ABX9KYI9_9BACI|nr:hypothetical protein D0U04_07230 [Bacillus clarus]
MKSEGETKNEQRFYTLPAYKEDRVEEKVIFTNAKSKSRQFKENVFYTLI